MPVDGFTVAVVLEVQPLASATFMV